MRFDLPRVRKLAAWALVAAGVAAAGALAAGGRVQPGLAALVVSLVLAAAAAGWTRTRPWSGPLLFWAALSLPLVKHLGTGTGLAAINADHVILYPVDVVIAVLLADAALARWTSRGGRADAGAFVRALGRLVKPDLVGWAVLATAAAAVVSTYDAPRPLLAWVALVDVARWYFAYVLFRELAGSGLRGVVVGLAVAAAAHSALCVVEFLAQNNFGLWEKPGWGGFVAAGANPKLATVPAVRGGGTFEPNVTAYFLQMALPFLAVYFLAARRLGRRVLFLAAGALAAAALFVTFSRGGWFGAGVALLVLLVVAWARRRDLGAPVWLLALLTAAAVVMALPATAILLARRGAADQLSAVSRLADWRIALQIIRDHPLLGVGRGNYLAISRLYSPWAFAYPVHNVYLWFWAETGLSGLAALAVMLYGGFRAAARAARRGGEGILFGAAALAAFTGVAFRMLVSMSFVHPFVCLTFLALAGAAAAAASRDE